MFCFVFFSFLLLCTASLVGPDEDRCCHWKACGSFLLSVETQEADHLNFEWGLCDLVWVKKKNSQTSRVRIFSPTYHGVRFFSSIYIPHEGYIFSEQEFFPLNVFPCKICFPLKSVSMIFFLKSGTSPQKSNGRPLIFF